MKAKPILLLLFVSEFNESLVPKYVSGALPNPLTYLYDKTTLSLSFPDLLKKYDEVYNSKLPGLKRIQDNSQTAKCGWFEQQSHSLKAAQCITYRAI